MGDWQVYSKKKLDSFYSIFNEFIFNQGLIYRSKSDFLQFFSRIISKGRFTQERFDERLPTFHQTLVNASNMFLIAS